MEILLGDFSGYVGREDIRECTWNW